MKDDPDKDFVLSLSRDKGFHIEPIPEAHYKTPDLKVMISTSATVLALKII